MNDSENKRREMEAAHPITNESDSVTPPEKETVAVIPTLGGRFNVFITADDGFCLSGNISLEQMKELNNEFTAAIAYAESEQ